MKTKLAIISSHPIQYNAPLFALIAESEKLEVKVFYTWSQSRDSLFDKDFGKTIRWDIPLLEGYTHCFISNNSKNPGPWRFNGIVCPGLIPEIRRWGAEVLLVYGWNYHAHYHAMRYFSGKIPVCFRGDSTLLDESGGIRQTVRRTFLRYIYHFVDYAFYVGKNNREYFLKHGFNPDHLFFAPHAIDNNRFSDHDGSKSLEAVEWRSQLNIDPDEIVVLFAGKFEPKKDPFMLLRAAVKNGFRGVHYIFTGNGILEEQMKKEAAGYSYIHFLPFQNQLIMPVLYRVCDLLCLPSRGPGETWGLVVNEAMACRRAILVSSKAGCAGDLVEEGGNGYVFEAGNTEQFEKILLGMTGSREKLSSMGNRSGEIISGWSYEVVRSSLEDNICKITS